VGLVYPPAHFYSVDAVFPIVYHSAERKDAEKETADSDPFLHLFTFVGLQVMIPKFFANAVIAA